MTPDPAVVRFSQLWYLGSVYNYRAWADVPRLRVVPERESLPRPYRDGDLRAGDVFTVSGRSGTSGPFVVTH